MLASAVFRRKAWLFIVVVVLVGVVVVLVVVGRVHGKSLKCKRRAEGSGGRRNLLVVGCWLVGWLVGS